MLPHINLNLLKALHTLLDTKSASASAKVLSISQPAVSKQLNSLREHFNDPLLVRSGGSNELTPRAQQLREQVDQAMGQMESLFGRKRFDPATSTLHFNIATSSAMVRNCIGDTIARVINNAPNMSLSFVPISRNVVKRMNMGEIDLYIGPLPLDADIAVESVKLSSVPTGCILSRQHPLALGTPEGSVLSVEQLEQYPQVIDRAGFSGSSLYDQYFASLGVAPRKLYSAMERGAALSLVQNTHALLLGYYPEHRFFDDDLGVTVRKLPGNVPKCDMGLCWPKYWSYNHAHRWLRTFFFELEEADCGGCYAKL